MLKAAKLTDYDLHLDGRGRSLFDIRMKENEEERIRDFDLDYLFSKKIWRVHDVARALGCSVGHVYNLSNSNRIPKSKKGKFLFFNPKEILDWIHEGDLHEKK